MRLFLSFCALMLWIALAYADDDPTRAQCANLLRHVAVNPQLKEGDDYKACVRVYGENIVVPPRSGPDVPPADVPAAAAPLPPQALAPGPWRDVPAQGAPPPLPQPELHDAPPAAPPPQIIPPRAAGNTPPMP